MILEEFKDKIKKDGVICLDSKIMLALSGGVDSMSLLLLLESIGIIAQNLNLVYVNHKQRIDSDNESMILYDHAKRNGHPFYSISLENVKKNTSETKLRDLRYSSLIKLAKTKDISVILTAHHFDDLAETFLMQMIRSGSIVGVNGIPERIRKSGILFYRPLLNFKKSEIIDYASLNKLTFFEDQSNFTDFTIRNRIRNHIFNDETLSSKDEEHFVNFTKQVISLKSDSEIFYNELIERFSLKNDDQIIIINLSILLKYPTLNFKNFLYYLFHSRQFYKINDSFINELCFLLKNTHKPQSNITITKDWEFFKEYNKFGIRKIIEPSNSTLPKFKYNEWFKIGSCQIGIFDLNLIKDQSFTFKEFISLPNESIEPEFRYRKPGDVVKFHGVKKKLRRFFIDNKIPNNRRDSLIILAIDEKILYLESFGITSLFKSKKTDRITSVILMRY